MADVIQRGVLDPGLEDYKTFGTGSCFGLHYKHVLPILKDGLP